MSRPSLSSSRTVLAFLIAPFAAAAIWYVLHTATLAVSNGGLRWRTDVLGLLGGSILVGVPMAAVVTWVGGAPVYLVLRWLGWLRLWLVVVAGALLGFLAVGLVLGVSEDGSALYLALATSVGACTAGFWWWVAQFQERSSRL